MEKNLLMLSRKTYDPNKERDQRRIVFDTQSEQDTSEQDISDVLNSISDPFIALDTVWQITYISQTLASCCGKTQSELSGRNFLDVFPNLHRTDIYQKYLKAMVEKVPVHFEAYGALTGSAWFAVNVYPRDEGITIFARDITNKKRMETEMVRLDRMNLVGEIAAGIAHEIRNSMTVIKGNLQILQPKQEFAAQQERFNLMIEEVDRANTIISEFISLARNTPLILKKQSINSIIETLWPLIQADAVKYGISVSLSLADTPELNLDEKQISQLVQNIARNGIEAMSGRGELSISTCIKQDNTVLCIKDQGPGIPPEVMEKLGTPFVTTKENGAGLGLPVCYRIAESHNAKIDIETGTNGTTFMISFPLPPA